MTLDDIAQALTSAANALSEQRTQAAEQAQEDVLPHLAVAENMARGALSQVQAVMKEREKALCLQETRADESRVTTYCQRPAGHSGPCEG